MVRHVDDIRSVEVKGDGIDGVTKKIAVGPKDGYDGYLRVFTIAPGGHTPYHSHTWHHANYILEGKGTITIEGTESSLRPGSVAYVDGGKKHQFKNVGDVPFVFICLVPNEGDAY